jgi:hypothetical protein
VDQDAPEPLASLLHSEWVAAIAPLPDLRLVPAWRVPRWRAWQHDAEQMDRCEIGLMDQK